MKHKFVATTLLLLNVASLANEEQVQPMIFTSAEDVLAFFAAETSTDIAPTGIDATFQSDTPVLPVGIANDTASVEDPFLDSLTPDTTTVVDLTVDAERMRSDAEQMSISRQRTPTPPRFGGSAIGGGNYQLQQQIRDLSDYVHKLKPVNKTPEDTQQTDDPWADSEDN